MEPEMVSTSVANAPAFLQLRDQYKQELVEDTRLTKAADLAAKHVLLASDAPDAWKRPQLKAVGRQLRHWTKKVRQPFGAPATGVRAPQGLLPPRQARTILRRALSKRGSSNWSKPVRV